MEESFAMSLEKKTVLIVDDDQAVRRGFKAILEKEGYSVEVAETGAEALDKIQTEKFDVLLIDVRLPDVDGTELLSRVSKFSDSIKIIITGFSSEEVGMKAADYGADDFLVKPVKPEDLLYTIRERLLLIQSKD
jgi:DNA-binding response OmpR family regulator